MQQSPIPYINERYSIWKRMAIFLIDALMTLGIFLALFFTLGVFSTKSICYEDINKMNEEIVEVCEMKKLDYVIEDRFGIAKLDYDKFMDKKVGAGDSVEKANEKYYEMQAEVDKLLNVSDNYVNAYKHFYGIYTASAVTSMAVPLVIFELLIPMLTKKHSTLGMLIFKVGLVDNKKDTSITNVKVLLRFLFIFTVEYLSVYLLLNWVGLTFMAMISMFLASFNNNRSSLHDMIIKAKVKPIADIYSE